MQFERFSNLNAKEKASALAIGSFERNGAKFSIWRSGGGEPWFKSDDPSVPARGFPEIHGVAVDQEADGLEFSAADEPDYEEYLDPDFRDVLAKMRAATCEEERNAIHDAWLLGGDFL